MKMTKKNSHPAKVSIFPMRRPLVSVHKPTGSPVASVQRVILNSYMRCDLKNGSRYLQI